MATADTPLLDRSPGAATAKPVDEIDAGAVDPQRFHEEYVLAHRPCVVRGAASHWRAVATWDAARIRELVGTAVVGSYSVGVLYEPLVEYSPDRVFLPPNRMTIDQFFDELDAHPDRRVQLYSEPLYVLEELRGDLGTLGILVDDRPPRFYTDRFFVSRRGYTDWHVHDGDETLTVQVLGRKSMLMLPPDADAAMRPMARRGVWKTPPASWPDGFDGLQPLRADLDPGDVIYIPMHWWHAVEAVGDDLNVTYAHVFPTPYRWVGEVRLHNTRAAVGHSLALAVLSSARARRPKYVRSAGRMAGVVALGTPAALWYHRRAAEGTAVVARRD